MHSTCIIVFFLAAFKIASCLYNNRSVDNINSPCLQSAVTSTTFQSPATQNSSISSSTSLQTAAVSTISQSPVAQNSLTSKSITAQASSSSNLSSSTSSSRSGIISSTTISSSNNLPQAPTPSTISNAQPSVSSSCVPGACHSYKLLACPGGVCACGQDINHIPICFLDKLCTDLAKCNNNAECGASEACAVNTCCGYGGYCTPLEVGCLTSPVWTAPLPEPIGKKVKARSISASGGGEMGITGFGVDTA